MNPPLFPMIFANACGRFLSEWNAVVGAAVVAAGLVPTFAAEPVSFNWQIRPLLADRCYHCHGMDGAKREAGRRLDTSEGAREDIDGVRAIVPGDLQASELWTRITSRNPEAVMPPPDAHRAGFSAAELRLVRRWILEGAHYEPHWAFVPPVDHPAPDRSDAIDFWIGQAHADRRLKFSPPAEPGEILRRVTLDLTGLPPTLRELREFSADSGPGAYERAVDRLLASPAYGEHMAMNWLDLARYGDSNGFQADGMRMQWPWRDWVVRAFNRNMRFDQFTIQQLAGDLLPEADRDAILATGFNRNNMLNAEGGSIPEENLVKNMFDRVETTGTVWLGLTMNCTQCHDHKFDPLTQRDYYSMGAFFNQLSESGSVNTQFRRREEGNEFDSAFMIETPFILVPDQAQSAHLEAAEIARVQAQQDLERETAEFAVLFASRIPGLWANPDRTRKALQLAGVGQVHAAAAAEKAAAVAVAAARQAIPQVMVMRDEVKRETRILERGSYQSPGEIVTSAVPSFLPPLPTDVPADRLAFANWMVAAEQPLTARVTVNRIWQQFFGRGIVSTPDDFGVQGALPTHPELLDHLAVDFRSHGWDVKRLARRIVLSRTYRQTAMVGADAYDRDPANQWLARGPRYRLDSRVLRDQALALSGLLSPRIGGAGVLPYQPPGIWEEMSFDQIRYEQDHGESLYRKSLYTFWRRTTAPASFFDVPGRQVCAATPLRTNTPLHALTTLNDPTYIEAARVWAESLRAGDGSTASSNSCLEELFLAATSRELDPATRETLMAHLQRARRHFQANPGAATALIQVGERVASDDVTPTELASWTSLILLVLNLDETLSH